MYYYCVHKGAAESLLYLFNVQLCTSEKSPVCESLAISVSLCLLCSSQLSPSLEHNTAHFVGLTIY